MDGLMFKFYFSKYMMVKFDLILMVVEEEIYIYCIMEYLMILFKLEMVECMMWYFV